MSNRDYNDHIYYLCDDLSFAHLLPGVYAPLRDCKAGVELAAGDERGSLSDKAFIGGGSILSFRNLVNLLGNVSRLVQAYAEEFRAYATSCQASEVNVNFPKS